MELLTFLFVKSDERQMNCLPLMKSCGTLGIMFHFQKKRGEERFREEGETAKEDREEGERRQKKQGDGRTSIQREDGECS